MTRGGTRNGRRKTEAGLIADLQPDPANRRKHGERNLGMVAAALREVGAARSIVIDEGNVVLAGNGVVAGAAQAGLTKLRVVDAAGDELIAVRRSGLSAEQKRALAIYDNRTAELAEWNTEQLEADVLAGLSLDPFWTPEEAGALLGYGAEGGEHRSLAERFGVPPFSVLDARQGYWQDRKRAWLALGIESELGRGGDIVPNGTERPASSDGAWRRKARKANAVPGGSPLPGIRGPRKDYKPGEGKRRAAD